MTEERISAQELLFMVAALKQQQVQQAKLAEQPEAKILEFPKKN